MANHSPSTDLLRQSLVGLKVLLLMTVLLGVLYPAAVWGVSRVAFTDRADGQIISVDGRDVGSRIIGQDFVVQDDDRFHSRPSAGDYDALASAPSNLGPSNPDLLASIEERQRAVAATEGVEVADVPADAVTASASGLDPYISPEYAALQIDRVAGARGLSTDVVSGLVEEATSNRQLGFLGQPRVNVLALNLALDDARP